MIKCAFCNALHIPNTVFCSECGHFLLEINQRVTEPMESDETDTPPSINNTPNHAASQPTSLPRFIRLQIGSRKREVEVKLDKPVHIGRVDPAGDIFPEIDITDDDPQSNLVSRRHARLFNQKNSIMVEDLGSINGTFLNGMRLPPFVPEIVGDGDRLQLGTLQMKVEFPG